MMPFTWSRGMFFVPLKFMCSHQCDTPVTPGPSSFEPTRYQHHTDASGAVCTSRIKTFRPLSRVVSRTIRVDAPQAPSPKPQAPRPSAYNSQIVMADWKDTCNLPRTSFSMKANLQTTEPETVSRWEEMDLYGRI